MINSQLWFGHLGTKESNLEAYHTITQSIQSSSTVLEPMILYLYIALSTEVGSTSVAIAYILLYHEPLDLKRLLHAYDWIVFIPKQCLVAITVRYLLLSHIANNAKSYLHHSSSQAPESYQNNFHHIFNLIFPQTFLISVPFCPSRRVTRPLRKALANAIDTEVMFESLIFEHVSPVYNLNTVTWQPIDLLHNVSNKVIIML